MAAEEATLKNGPTVSSSTKSDNIVRSEAFLTWLRENDIIPARTHRVIIDAEAGKVLKIFIEMYGSERMLRHGPPPDMHGASVEVI